MACTDPALSNGPGIPAERERGISYRNASLFPKPTQKHITKTDLRQILKIEKNKYQNKLSNLYVSLW